MKPLLTTRARGFRKVRRARGISIYRGGLRVCGRGINWFVGTAPAKMLTCPHEKHPLDRKSVV